MLPPPYLSVLMKFLFSSKHCPLVYRDILTHLFQRDWGTRFLSRAEFGGSAHTFGPSKEQFDSPTVRQSDSQGLIYFQLVPDPWSPLG